MVENKPNPLGRLQSNFPKALGLIFALVVFILVISTVYLYRNMAVVKDQEKWIAHTHEVVISLEKILGQIKDAEISQLEYLVTYDQSFLNNFELAKANLDGSIALLQTLVADNQIQLKRAELLKVQVQAKINRMQLTVDEANKSRTKSSTQRLILDKDVIAGLGQNFLLTARSIISEMRTMEEGLLINRQKEAAISAQGVNQSFFIIMLINGLSLFLTYFYIRRYFGQQNTILESQANENWLKTNLNKMSADLSGDQDIQHLGRMFLDFVATILPVQAATFYISRNLQLELIGSFALQDHRRFENGPPAKLPLGSGLLGEVFLQKKIMHIEDAPKDYLHISSTLGEASSTHLIILPIISEGVVLGVVEFASFKKYTEIELRLLEQAGPILASMLQSSMNRERLADLLFKTQEQAEELQTQQEELRQNNEELEQQAQALEAQKDILSTKNDDLITIRTELETKARDLERAGRYKSEFLANMSHELRTPLNSLLILSTLLMENKEGNLRPKQIDFAKTIHRSGSDLLLLINDILDLAKVESGKVSLSIEDVEIIALAKNLESNFKIQAEEKGLIFDLHIPNSVPGILRTDKLRLEQILKNLLSNSLKFTTKGSVRLEVSARLGMSEIAFKVIDTGIGIPEDKLQMIFEAFQQADATTTREYGGTGLGLTISRELAHLLGGEITVESRPGKGSQFTLTLPLAYSSLRKAYEDESSSDDVYLGPQKTQLAVSARSEREANLGAKVEGDVDLNTPHSSKIIPRILIIEDDRNFAQTLMEMAHEYGLKAIWAQDGESGLAALNEYPISGVVLDIKLPGMSGMGILEKIKSNSHTWHLPVHVISAYDFAHNVMKMGAVGHLTKPATREQLSEAFSKIEKTMSKVVKKVLIVEDDPVQGRAIQELLAGSDVQTTIVNRGDKAFEELTTSAYDCLVLDLRLPDMTGLELLEKLDRNDFDQKEVKFPRPPVVVYTGKDLSAAEEESLRRYSESIVIKGAKSPERLLDEVGLFLHRVETALPLETLATLKRLRSKESIFEGRKILLVDDDIRNVFALLSALESQGLEVMVAKNGKEALERLQSETKIDLVLMDIMMPIMDGHQAMQEIRKTPKLKNLPIIALTAKAMKGDQEKCLESGANDYLSKPIDFEKLLSLMRVWLPNRDGFFNPGG